MDRVMSLAAWMADRGVGRDELRRRSALGPKVLDALIQGRYTPSPQQRLVVARALGVEPEQIAWGHTAPVEHLYGHGPQFGRTP